MRIAAPPANNSNDRDNRNMRHICVNGIMLCVCRQAIQQEELVSSRVSSDLLYVCNVEINYACIRVVHAVGSGLELEWPTN